MKILFYITKRVEMSKKFEFETKITYMSIIFLNMCEIVVCGHLWHNVEFFLLFHVEKEQNVEITLFGYKNGQNWMGIFF